MSVTRVCRNFSSLSLYSEVLLLPDLYCQGMCSLIDPQLHRQLFETDRWS
jgi:hypothetical protein